MSEKTAVVGKNGTYEILQKGSRYYLFLDGKPHKYEPSPLDEITYDPYDRVLICRNGRDVTFRSIDRDHVDSYEFRDWEEPMAEGYTRSFSDVGKVGLKKGGKVILPEQFDDVDKWNDCDVLYTRLGMTIRYFDLQGNEILKNRRDLGDSEDHLYPYSHNVDSGNSIVQTMDFRPQPEGEDFCICHGQRVGLSRRTIKEHAAWLRQISNIVACPSKWFLESKIAKYHEAYLVQSRPGVKFPLNDCLRQLLAAHLLGSWNVSFTILVPESSKKELTESEIHITKRLDYMNRDNDSNRIYFEDISKGSTSLISEGIILIATTYIIDCYPPCLLPDVDNRDIEKHIKACENCPHHCWNRGEKEKQTQDKLS